MRIRKLANDLLTMSKAEQNGALVLLVLLVLLIILRFLTPQLLNNKESYRENIREMIDAAETNESKYKEELENKASANVKSEEAGKSFLEKSPAHSRKADYPMRKINYFIFDPNTITKPELMNLGFTDKAANVFINFRNRGAVFHHKSDLLKVYSIDSAMYLKLEPYISISDQPTKSEIIEQPKALPVKNLEINSADSALWTTLPGIGPVFASRICKFRDYLGGFVKIEQLMEVYNFTEERYMQIYSLLTIDTTKVTRINLNFASVNDLRRHPYCNDETARKIVDYRSKAGSFHSVAILITDSVLTSNEFDKLSPYLQVTR
jgi:competence protein ComEA